MPQHAVQKTEQLAHFRALNRRILPKMWPAPTPEQAYRLGLKKGYGEGLVEGVLLGIEMMMSPATTVVAAAVPFDVN